MLLTFSTDSVQRKGKFSVRGQTKTRAKYPIFDDALLEIVGYQSDAAHGTEGIIYLNPYLFGGSFSVVVTHRIYMNKSIDKKNTNQ